MGEGGVHHQKKQSNNENINDEGMNYVLLVKLACLNAIVPGICIPCFAFEHGVLVKALLALARLP